MSGPDPKGGEWLRQQIEELGALRNASVRDPQFKAWRQNTLTFIQRIWVGDSSKSERFRRVPFSPPSSKADARSIREHFERGCGEALEYLNTLLTQLGEEKVAPGTTRAVPKESERFEGDFPAVELGTGSGEPARSDGKDAPMEFGDGPVLDLPSVASTSGPRSSGPSRLPDSAIKPGTPEGLPEDFAGATPLDHPAAAANGETPKAEGAPATSSAATPPPAAPETPRISVRGSAKPPATPPANPLKDILAPHRVESAPRGPKNGKKSKPAKGRLKDMLGLSSFEAEADAAPSPAPEPVTASEPPAPVESPAPALPVTDFVPPPLPGAKAPSSVPAAEGEAPASRSMPDWTHPEFLAPIESLPPLTAMDVEPTHEAETAALPSEPEAAGEFDPFAHDEPEASREPEVSEHSETAAEEETRADDRRRATQEFLRNSPVLSSTPRPVQRRGAPPPERVTELPTRESAASRILAIASEVDTLGIPSSQRARVRRALMDLAGQLDEPEISWSALREAVGLAMEFPPVARRALPVLLPFLDVAA